MKRISGDTTSRLLAAAFLFTVFTACSDSPTGPGPRVELRRLSEQEALLVEADNLFGLKLFRATSEVEGETNVILSPLSVAMALGMTLNGAAGETRTGMETALELSGLTEEEINASYRSLIKLLTAADPQVTFEIANSIWYRDSYPIATDFVGVNETYFDAVVQALDFSAADAAGIINAWVSEKTHDRIEEIVDDPIDPLTMMFLINAIYFKGDWLTQFDPDDTADGTFHLADGSTVQVPMMRLSDTEITCSSEAGWLAADLAYGDSLFSMTLILPPAGTDLETFIAGLDRSTWEAIIADLAPRELDFFQMPTFELEYEVVLNQVLAGLGMACAFSDGADFSRMNALGESTLHISEVRHKTWLKVDEVGTEAAAVTSVVMAEGSVGPSYVFDRPFILAIRERSSGTILFIGKVMDPSG